MIAFANRMTCGCCLGLAGGCALKGDWDWASANAILAALNGWAALYPIFAGIALIEGEFAS